MDNNEKPQIPPELQFENELEPITDTNNASKNKRKPAKPTRKSRRGLATKNYTMDKFHKHIMTCICREMTSLMVKTYRGKLDKEESLQLCNYAKLHKQLMKTEEDLSANITDEELERIVNKSTNKKT